MLDLRRAEAERGGLGRLLTELANGTAGPAMQRAAASNGQALLHSPLTVLAVVGVLMLAFCQFSPWGGLKRLFGLHPALRAAGAGITVATLLAGLFGQPSIPSVPPVDNESTIEGLNLASAAGAAIVAIGAPIGTVAAFGSSHLWALEQTVLSVGP